jgi:hypothetical protein
VLATTANAEGTSTKNNASTASFFIASRSFRGESKNGYKNPLFQNKSEQLRKSLHFGQTSLHLTSSMREPQFSQMRAFSSN